jgi:uncharacterized protein (TIGR01244 family)
MPKSLLIALATVALALAGCSRHQPEPTALADLPVAIEDAEGFRTGLWRTGDVFISGQPTEDALKRLASDGFTTVVNLRTPEEMADREHVPFDEAQVAADCGLAYVSIPMNSRDYPYAPAMVDSLAAVVERHDGKLLLHCTAGWRATHLWVAYLIKFRGMPLEVAYEHGRAMNIGRPPLEAFLDRSLGLRYVETSR